VRQWLYQVVALSSAWCTAFQATQNGCTSDTLAACMGRIAHDEPGKRLLRQPGRPANQPLRLPRRLGR
jgi:hypothetical protein